MAGDPFQRYTEATADGSGCCCTASSAPASRGSRTPTSGRRAGRQQLIFRAFAT